MKPVDLSAVSLGTVLGTTSDGGSLESIVASAAGAVAVYLVKLLFEKLSNRLKK